MAAFSSRMMTQSVMAVTSRCAGLPGKTSFAEKITGSYDRNHRLLALLGNDGELRLALLDVKDRVRRVSLGEDNLILAEPVDDAASPTLARNFFGSNDGRRLTATTHPSCRRDVAAPVSGYHKSFRGAVEKFPRRAGPFVAVPHHRRCAILLRRYTRECSQRRRSFAGFSALTESQAILERRPTRLLRLTHDF